jgi:putative membrane protein
MLRLLATATLALIGNAVALIVASLVLEDFSLDAEGFVIALLVFTGVGVLIEPLIRQTAMRSAPALLGSTALIATLVGLVVTAIVSDGLQIDGAATWALATVLVWAVALAARLLLPLVLFKKVLAEARND